MEETKPDWWKDSEQFKKILKFVLGFIAPVGLKWEIEEIREKVMETIGERI